MTDLTPVEWRDKLLIQLAARRPDIAKLYRYYEGEHPDPCVTQDVREAYRELLRLARSNWCHLIVQARSNRLRPIGVRFSEGVADETTDLAVWKRLWQANRLDADSRLVHDAALVARRGFVLVWPGMKEGDPPSITPEHPSEVVVAYQGGSRRHRLAALKCFTDLIGGVQYTCLWLPESVHLWKRPVVTSGLYQANGVPFADGGWGDWYDPGSNILPEGPNPLGFVPMFEFQADPQLGGEPRGALDGGVIDIQDRINKTTLNRLVASEHSAFQQKWATGLEIPVDPETGKQIEPFRSAVDRMFANENPDGAFGAFPLPDLRATFTAPTESDIQQLVAISSTPPHYLIGPSQNPPAAETLKAAEVPLVSVVKDATVCLTETWEDVVRAGCLADGKPDLAADLAMEVVWADPEIRSEAELADAAMKRKAIGVPWRQNMEFLGFSPIVIARMEEERQRDAQLAALTAPLDPTAAPLPVAAV